MYWIAVIVVNIKFLQSVSNVKLLSVNIDVELNFNHHIALLCNKAGRQINFHGYQMF